MRTIAFGILFLSLITLFRCGKRDAPSLLKVPVAKAGLNQELTSFSTTLDGSHSVDPNGHGLSYTWSVVASPYSVVIADPHAAKTPITLGGPGLYKLILTVKSLNLSAKDSVTLTAPSVESVIFWRPEDGSDCYCAGPITVSVDTITRILNGYLNLAPKDCSDPNGLRFDLKPGTYSWKAIRGKDTLKGVIDLYLGCKRIPLIF
jgi:hypothetical protein